MIYSWWHCHSGYTCSLRNTEHAELILILWTINGTSRHAMKLQISSNDCGGVPTLSPSCWLLRKFSDAFLINAYWVLIIQFSLICLTMWYFLSQIFRTIITLQPIPGIMFLTKVCLNSSIILLCSTYSSIVRPLDKLLAYTHSSISHTSSGP